MDLIKIGKYIAGKRKSLGMTQKQLAEKLGMSDKSVSKWERCPLWKPPQEKAVRYPSTGRIPPFLVIQPSGCIG